MHADYNGTRRISKEHKSLYEVKDSEPKRPIVERVRETLGLGEKN